MTSKTRQPHVHAVEPVEPDHSPDVETPSVPTYDIIMNNIKPSVPKELVKIFLSETLWKQISDAERKLIIDYNRKIPNRMSTSRPPTTTSTGEVPPPQEFWTHRRTPCT